MKTLAKITLVILIATLLVSCTKTELPQESKVHLILMKPNTFKTKEEGEKTRDLQAVRAELDTDKGTFNFNQLTPSGWSYRTESVYMPNDVYRITDIRLYDAEDNLIMQVHHGAPTPQDKDGLVVNWVYDPQIDGECIYPQCSYNYYVEEDRYFSFQVWPLD